MTLVEVIVAALMVGLIAMSLIGLQAAGRTTQDQRVRSQAAAIAQADQERMRGMNADQLTKLSQTRTVTVEGTDFTVTSTAAFVSHASGASSCSGAGADYAKVISSVDWTNNRRGPMVEQSLITPPSGGSLLVQTIDQNGTALPGVTATVAGTDDDTDSTRRSAVTDAEGCAIFSGLTDGDYDVTMARNGYVDPDGDATPTTPATVTVGNTASTQFTLGLAGRVSASFTTLGGTATGQLAPSLTWWNPGMATAGTATPGSPSAAITTPTTLFPFITGPGVYTGNYSLWAGCEAAKPPPANLGTASVPPGATSPTTTIDLPAMIVSVRFRTSTTTAYSFVKPRDLRLTLSACSQSWHPPIDPAPGPSAPSTGWLDHPGQAYGDHSVCAEYRPSSTTYRGFANVNNTTYGPSGNAVLVSITGTGANQGNC